MNNEKDPTDLLSAITGGLDNPPDDNDLVGDLGEEGGDPPEGEVEETPEGEEGGEAEETDEESEEETDEEEGEEEAEEDEESEEDEPELDENGNPKKPAKGAKEEAFDPLTFKLAKGTLQRTVEGFERLRTAYKDERTAREKAETSYQQVSDRHNGLVDMITSAGLDAQRFNTMIGYAEHFNSPAFEDRQKAYKFLVGELTALAKDLGETPPGVHPLTGHDDLIAAVQNKSVDMKLAIETAQNRNREAARAAHEQKNGERLRQQNEGNAAKTQAQGQLKTLGVELSKKDGQKEFARKAKIVIDNMLDDIKALPPARWAGAFRKAYNLIPAAAVAPKPKPKPQPLRGNKGMGAGGSKQPKTLKDAVFGAFDKS